MSVEAIIYFVILFLCIVYSCWEASKLIYEDENNEGIIILFVLLSFVWPILLVIFVIVCPFCYLTKFFKYVHKIKNERKIK